MSNWPMKIEASGRLSTHHGVKVFDLDEQIFVALGHHEDKRRVVAAMNGYAREQLGRAGLSELFHFWPSYTRFAGELKERFAVVLDEKTAEDEEVFFESDDPAERVIYPPDEVTAATAGAFPVTVWD